MAITFYPRQITAMDDCRLSIRQGHRAPIIVAPTGAGKTVIGSGIIQSAVAKGSRVLFLAHRKELITQCRKKLIEFGINSGIIMAGKQLNLAWPVQVASVQTLVRRMETLAWRPDIIMIDECHLSNAETYKKIIEFYGFPVLVGLSATPQRLDGSGLGKGHGGMFDDLVIAGTVRELIDDGTLCKYIYFAPQLVHAEDVQLRGKEYAADELEKISDTPKIIGDCIDHWKRLALGRPTMVFAVTVKHAEHIAERAKESGIKALAVSADTDDYTREKALIDVQNGKLDWLINVGLFIEGVDAPAVSCIIMLAATKSLVRFRQSIGRGMRKHPGKTNCIILDHVGNCNIHGLPDSPITWSLEGKKKRPKKTDAIEDVIALRVCPNCWCTHEVADTCPQCGWNYITKQRKGPQEVDGQLMQIGGDHQDILIGVTPQQLEEQKKQERRAQLKKARTLEDLTKLEREWGYAPGWATKQFEFRKQAAARHTQRYYGERGI